MILKKLNIFMRKLVGNSQLLARDFFPDQIVIRRALVREKLLEIISELLEIYECNFFKIEDSLTLARRRYRKAGLFS